MALGGCYNCLKYLMFVFNFIFWLVGCALLSVGIWAKVDESSLEELLHDSEISSTISVASWIIIVVGSVVMVLGFLGCCGAIRESQCMLATFFIFLFIIFLALIGVGVYVYMGYKDDPESIKKKVAASLKDDVYNYYNNTESKKKLDKLHADYDCCGAEKGDFHAFHGEPKVKVACGDNWSSEKGCADKAYEQAEKLLKHFFVIFVAVAFGIATIMLLGMIFSMLLCCAIRETVA